MDSMLVDPKVSYVEMLEFLLGNKEDLQTPLEAIKVLEIAIEATKQAQFGGHLSRRPQERTLH